MKIEQQTLLGLPPYLEQSGASKLQRLLNATWAATMGQPPGELTQDLVLCRRWFDPVAQGQRLRRELSQLRALPDDLEDPGPPWTFPVGSQKRVVTPEGRCTLDLLQRLPDRATQIISDAQLIHYDRLLGNLYRSWGRHRLESVVELLVGSNKPLQIPAAGVVVALLVNRCTTERRALTRFASGSARDIVDRAFFTPVQAFADIITPRHRGNRSNPRLVSGWMLYEARRRLGDGLAIQDARAGHDGKVWIQPESESHVIDVVARDLARGHRARVNLEQFGRAYDALVDNLRKELPKLAGFGLVHERPPATRQLRERLLDNLARQLAVEA